MGYAANAVEKNPSRLELYRFLLESGANPNHTNWLGISYLHKEAAAGRLETMKLLIEFGADLEAVDDEFCTSPLGWAARTNQMEVAMFLLSLGVARQPIGAPAWSQPIEWARRRGNIEMVLALEA